MKKYKSVIFTISLCFLASSVYANKNKDRMCKHYKEKKEYAEDVMKNGYQAYEYDRLEKQRKYWKNLYIKNCFN